MPHDEAAAHRYARALFELVKQKGTLSAVENSFVFAAGLFEKHPEILRLLKSPTVRREEKEGFIDRILPSGTEKILLSFLKVLVRKKRISAIAAIQENFHALFEKDQGLCEVHVITARKLSAPNRNRLSVVLKNKLHSEIRLIESVDESLLGGLILRFEGIELNASYQDGLKTLKQRLMH